VTLRGGLLIVGGDGFMTGEVNKASIIEALSNLKLSIEAGGLDDGARDGAREGIFKFNGVLVVINGDGEGAGATNDTPATGNDGRGAIADDNDVDEVDIDDDDADSECEVVELDADDVHDDTEMVRATPLGVTPAVEALLLLLVTGAIAIGATGPANGV